MKLSFETFGEAKLAVIPLYPLAAWNKGEQSAKEKEKGKLMYQRSTRLSWNCKAIQRTQTALRGELSLRYLRMELRNNGAAGAKISNEPEKN